MQQQTVMKKQPKKLYNLQVWSKTDGIYRHTDTISYAQPYAICKANKQRFQKQHFQFLKIIRNDK